MLPLAYGVPLPKLSDFADEPRAQLEAWRASPAGQPALRIYETERGSARRID